MYIYCRKVFGEYRLQQRSYDIIYLNQRGVQLVKLWNFHTFSVWYISHLTLCKSVEDKENSFELFQKCENLEGAEKQNFIPQHPCSFNSLTLQLHHRNTWVMRARIECHF